MTTFNKSSELCIFLTLLLVAIAPFYGVPSTEEYILKKSTRPVHLQSMINPKENTNELTWLGADAATSVEVNPDRYVWLFGDTILGKKEGGSRKYSIFILTKIGLSAATKGD